MGYIARQFSTFESEMVSPSEVLCLPCLWAEWLHRGRLTANDGTTAYYNGMPGYGLNENNHEVVKTIRRHRFSTEQDADSQLGLTSSSIKHRGYFAKSFAAL